MTTVLVVFLYPGKPAQIGAGYIIRLYHMFCYLLVAFAVVLMSCFAVVLMSCYTRIERVV